MSSRPKTDEVFIRRMAEILRLMRRRTDNQTSTPTAGAQSSTTQNIETISDNSALNNQTPSTSANIEQSQDFSEPSYATPISPQIDDESDIAAAAHLELPNAQSILLTCIDFVLRSKYGCSRALTPEEERDRNGWPFKPKLNSVIVEYYFRLKLTFGLLVISDRNGHYVFVQNIKKAFEYKVFCLDRVFIPTLDIFENDETGTENLIKFKVELNKYTGIFDFVVSSLVDEFIMKSRRTQVEFCRDAVEFDASQNTKKVKFNEETHTSAQARLVAFYKELPNVELTPTIKLLGIFVEFIDDHVKCSIAKSSPWPVALTYAGEYIMFTINKESFSMSLIDIGIGCVLILRNDAYVFLTGRYLTKDIIPSFDEEDDIDNDRFPLLSSYINKMVDYLLNKYYSRTASRSTPGTPKSRPVNTVALENHFTMADFIESSRTT